MARHLNNNKDNNSLQGGHHGHFADYTGEKLLLNVFGSMGGTKSKQVTRA